MRDDVAIERRLEREAQTVKLPNITHPGCEKQAEVTGCVVEVTWQVDADDPEHAGYHLVWVPSIAATGNDDVDRDNHPAKLAEDAVDAHYASKDYAYFSIDDVTAYQPGRGR